MSTTPLRIASLLALPALVACQMEQPFSGPGFQNGVLTTDAEGPFFVSGTYFDAENHSEANDEVSENMSEMMKAMEHRTGLVATSTSFVLFSVDDYRTVSVWETEEAMQAWLDSDARARAMYELADHLDRAETAVWTIEREDMPPTWDEARRQLDEHGEDAY